MCSGLRLLNGSPRMLGPPLYTDRYSGSWLDPKTLVITIQNSSTPDPSLCLANGGNADMAFDGTWSVTLSYSAAQVSSYTVILL